MRASYMCIKEQLFFCPAACIINIFNAYYQMLIVHFTISSSHFFQRNVSNCGLHGLCFLLLKIVMLTVRFCLIKWYMITIQYRQLLFVLKLYSFIKFLNLHGLICKSHLIYIINSYSTTMNEHINAIYSLAYLHKLIFLTGDGIVSFYIFFPIQFKFISFLYNMTE